MVAMTGPIPKRSDARRRTNTTTESGVSNEVDKVVVNPDDLDDVSSVDAPEANEDWHRDAIAMYESFKRSAMRVFYEPTDWQTAYLLCDQLSRHLYPQPLMGPEGPVTERKWDEELGDEVVRVVMRVLPMPGSTLSAILKGFTELGATEGARRRLRIEVERRQGGEQTGPVTGPNVIDIRSARLG